MDSITAATVETAALQESQVPVDVRSVTEVCGVVIFEEHEVIWAHI